MTTNNLALPESIAEVVEDYVEGNTRKNEEKYFDFGSLRLESIPDIKEEWIEHLTFAQNVKAILEASICMPDKDMQLPIFTAYASVPSALANILPILFLQGKEGTGKSQAALLLCGIFKSEILSATTTYAALRNKINKLRWQAPELQDGELNYCCFFDNVNSQTFMNDNLYSFFLSGYNRKTDAIEISKGDGSNMVFKVFGPKVCTSIHPVYVQPRMAELTRRLIVLKFKRFEELSEGEQDSFDINSRIDMESMDLMYLHHKFNQLWSYTNCQLFGELKKELTARKKGFKIPKVIKATRWTLCPDLIASGLVSGVWNDIQSAVDGFAEYWEWYDLNVGNAIGSLQKACLTYMNTEEQRLLTLRKQLGDDLPIEIRCEVLKNHLDALGRTGALEVYATPQNVTLVMGAMGWTRDIGVDGDWVWIRVK